MFDRRSNHIAVHVSEAQFEAAVQFYSTVFGLRVEEKSSGRAYLIGQNYRMFVVSSDRPMVAQEFMVKDLAEARRRLEQAGCRILSWDGKGKSNGVQDPYGLVFNVWLDEG